MTPEILFEVQDSFQAVRAQADEVADVFYTRLFAAEPGLRSMFPADLSNQKTKLMKALTLAVGALDKPEALRPVLLDLGTRHAGYGVTDEHYAIVGGALLDTLAAMLGARFTPDCQAAWTAVYGVVAETMQEGAKRAAAA